MSARRSITHNNVFFVFVFNPLKGDERRCYSRDDMDINAMCATGNSVCNFVRAYGPDNVNGVRLSAFVAGRPMMIGSKGSRHRFDTGVLSECLC